MVNNKIRVLFLIHDLGPGGAEKVLVNLANNLDRERYLVTILSLFDVGANRDRIANHVEYKWCFKKMPRGNVTSMKLLSPSQLHKWLIKDHYDVEIAYLEGPCARIISGCTDPNVLKLAWIHCQQTLKKDAGCFRTYNEAISCYNRFKHIYCVSQNVKDTFSNKYDSLRVPIDILYNTLETIDILNMGTEEADEIINNRDVTNIIAVGKLIKNKGIDRIIRIIKKIKDDGENAHLYILGNGGEAANLQKMVLDLELSENVTFLGYQINPYKYVSKCDLFICASLREGFSTAASEALILGVPVITVDVGGMREMLGDNNEYGVVVSNNDNDLYQALRKLLIDRSLLMHYKEQAIIRGRHFSKDETVRAVELEIERLL